MDAGHCSTAPRRWFGFRSGRSGVCVESSTRSSSWAGVVTAVVIAVFLVRYLGPLTGWILRWYFRQATAERRRRLLAQTVADEQRFSEDAKSLPAKRGTENDDNDDDEWENVDAQVVGSAGNGEKGAEEWDGIVGFFHPFCNAGGGGERVLWAAIRATQQRWPKAKCVVYTGDQDVQKDAILSRVGDRFNIHLHPPTVSFLYLTTRHWVLASTWPRFTLAGQSLGSLIMAWDAFSLLVPDIFIDTMGYAFSLGLSKLLFPNMPTGAYVHYPTISTDMLDSLDPTSATGSQGVNAGQGVGLRGAAKQAYWRVFAQLYAAVGASVDVVMTNSSWTQAHIQTLWGPLRTSRRFARHPANATIAIVYPPVAVTELEQAVAVSPASEAARESVLLYIAQFRPEKNHGLILQAFASFLQTTTKPRPPAAASRRLGAAPDPATVRLVLVGSVRDDQDSARVNQLRRLVDELQIGHAVEFHLDAPWPDILRWLGRASVGVNGMWNEHFGIGVVEYQAAGLIAVVHDSGGPKLDIVTNIDGLPTGFHAATADEFAQAFESALSLPDPLAWRKRARRSAKRFTEEEFAKKWIEQIGKLVKMAS